MRKALRLLLTLSVVIVRPMSYSASACTVCHSKNPKMVRMHKELGFKDCFKCHAQGLEPKGEGQERQMAHDPRCAPCHRK